MKNFLLLIAFFISNFFFSQEMINYKNKGNKIEFTISTTEYFAKYSENNEASLKFSQKDDFQKMSNNSALLSLKEYSGNFAAKKQEIRNHKNLPIEKVEPVLIYKDGTRQIVDGQISISINSGVDLKSILNKWNFTITQNEFDKNVYLLTSNSYPTDEIFKIVNELQMNKDIEFAEPNFIRLITPNTADPYFNSQWAIKNQGYNGGTVGADMKVENAWNYATGSGIKVAIIDEGVDLVHPDLVNNLLAGYDATGNNSNGAPSGNDAHGTACAGIVVATANNNIGIAGISYNAKVLPVRIAYSSNGSWVSTDNGIANGINWAWQNGADILSNSWGGGSSSSTIISAINNAVNNGRNGKGSVVLFSTGNDDTSVGFPATQPNVIAVGASNMFDERKSPATAYHDECWYLDCHGGSNYGSELDVVAPGVMIATSDISGSAGYTTGDYTSYFNGTSSACPNVAGIVALILSVNPNLTQTQARAYLEKNTDKVLPTTYAYQANASYPNGTWNNQTGYGRVNAQKAVEDVFFANVQLNGTGSTCNASQFTYNLTNIPSGYSPVWSYSSNLTNVSQTSSTITVAPIGGSSGSAWVKATFGTKEIIKSFWLGSPVAYVHQINNPNYYNESHFYLSDANGNPIVANEQGITQVKWTKISSNPQYGVYLHAGLNDTSGWASGQNNNWTMEVKLEITNSCGTNIQYVTITPPPAAPCDTYKLAKDGTSDNYSVLKIIEPPCSSNKMVTSKQGDQYQITVANSMGTIIISTIGDSFDLQSLPTGMYVVNISKDNKAIIKQTLTKN